MAVRVISWQSNNSMRCRLWQDTKCSSVRSVIRGQLSSSSTDRISAAQLPVVRCRIPSSVISSQCDRVYWKATRLNSVHWSGLLEKSTNFSKLGQPVARWANVRSVIWLHSSRSIRSRYLQFRPSAWKPMSVKLRHPDTSRVFSRWLCCERDNRVRSVRSAHLDTHNFCSLWQLAASWRIDESVMVCKIQMILKSYCHLTRYRV